jgi:hypothetical protein
MRAPSGIASRASPSGSHGRPSAHRSRDERRDRLQRRRHLDDCLADHPVAAHEHALVLVERAGLGQDRVGDRDVADVVQLGGARDDVARLRAKARRGGGARARPCARSLRGSRWRGS